MNLKQIALSGALAVSSLGNTHANNKFFDVCEILQDGLEKTQVALELCLAKNGNQNYFCENEIAANKDRLFAIFRCQNIRDAEL